MVVYATTPHDPILASKIWQTYKPTLEEKHGSDGVMGLDGETAAAHFLGNADYFPENKYIVSHEDCLHQLLGIDITVIKQDGTSVFVDAKTGKTSLYWTPEDGWYITLKPELFTNHKRTDAIMHLGPKKDVFAFYNINTMKDFLAHRLPSAFKKTIMLHRRHWPAFIASNL